MQITKYINVFKCEYDCRPFSFDEIYDTKEEAIRKVTFVEDDDDSHKDEDDLYEEYLKQKQIEGYVKTIPIKFNDKEKNLIPFNKITIWDRFSIIRFFTNKQFVTLQGKKVKLVSSRGRKKRPFVGYIIDQQGTKLHEWDSKGRDNIRYSDDDLYSLPESLKFSKTKNAYGYAIIYKKHDLYHVHLSFKFEKEVYGAALVLKKNGYQILDIIKLDLSKEKL